MYSREDKARDIDPAGVEGEEDLVNAFSDLKGGQNRTLWYKL